MTQHMFPTSGPNSTHEDDTPEMTAYYEGLAYGGEPYISERSSELLPCPFCGAEASIDIYPAHKHIVCGLPDYEGSVIVECVDCCMMQDDTEQEVIGKWNRRESVWIPTAERLPESEKVCLIYAPNIRPEYSIDVAIFSTIWIALTGVKRTGVTHWMPLPQPPERGE